MEMAMKMKIRLAALAAVACLAVPMLAYAGGMWQTWVGIGQPSYCASVVSGVTLPSGQGPYGVVPGSTQGTGQGPCAQTVPAGPSLFTGNEYVPVDLGPLGSTSSGPTTSAVVTLPQLGQGALLDVTSVTSSTIPGGTPFYLLDGTQSSAFTITMPANPVEGYIQRIACESSTAGTLTVTGNVGQNVKNNPNTTCAAGTNYAWRYQASGSTWYRF
jgi:hypothetical protein